MSVDHVDTGISQARQGPLFRFRCTNCAYGASRQAAPEQCPMCGGSTWEHESWRPFSALTRDIAPGPQPSNLQN
jgi:hypothetical protein